MRIPSIRTRRDMEMVAELRAAGASWETAAKQVERQPNLVMRWARVYRDEWEQFLREAEERLSQQASNESRSVLRVLLRHKNSKIRLSAADKLTKLRLEEKAAERPKTPDVNMAAIVACVEQMTRRTWNGTWMST